MACHATQSIFSAQVERANMFRVFDAVIDAYVPGIAATLLGSAQTIQGV